MKLQEKIRTTLENINLEMDLKITISEEKITVDFVKELLKQLMSMKESQNVEFVLRK